jgi:hypothetical protein
MMVQLLGFAALNANLRGELLCADQAPRRCRVNPFMPAAFCAVSASTILARLKMARCATLWSRMRPELVRGGSFLYLGY